MAERTVNIRINYQIDTQTIQKARAASEAAQKTTDDLRKSATNAGKEFKKAGEEGQKAFQSLNGLLKTVSFAIITKQVLDFTKEVIKVRGEFQKFEAVLTNTLGSKSQALIALGRIVEFAKSTPFGVAELTNSFIKLANRGVQPTVRELRAIADLSATLGKDFNQVVEAVLDINNPERWKEIGIKAQTAGDKVTLSFRGVNQEVARTERGVLDAVVALGQLNGVAGSTEAISRTLAGQTSNLSDAWEQLLNTIGKGNEGVLFEAVGLLSKALEAANNLLKSTKQEFEELEGKTLASETEDFEKLVRAFGNVDRARELFARKTEERIQQLNEQFNKIRDSMEKVSDFDVSGDAGADIRNRAREQEMQQLNMLIDIYLNSLPTAIDETVKKLTEVSQVKTIIVPELHFDDSMTHEEYLRVKSKLEEDSKKNEIEFDFKISDKEMDKIQEDAYNEIVAGINLAKEEAGETPIEMGDILFGKNGENKTKMEEFKTWWSDNWRDILSQGFADTAAFIKGINDAEIESLRFKLDSTEEFYDKQLSLAGDNERAKAQIRKQEERDTAKLRRSIAEKEWEARRNAVIIDTAAGIMRAFSTAPNIYVAIAQAAIVATQGVTQLSEINRNKPRFAKGVINLSGPGTGTSDSIDAKLSKGESVITADATSRSMKLLDMIQHNKIDDKILRNIDFSGGKTVHASLSDDRIVKELVAIKSGQNNQLETQGRLLYRVYKDGEGNKVRRRSKLL